MPSMDLKRLSLVSVLEFKSWKFNGILKCIGNVLKFHNCTRKILEF